MSCSRARRADRHNPPEFRQTFIPDQAARPGPARDERLDAFRLDLTTNAQIDRFNRLVDDWNSRCSRYRYREDSMQAVQRELGARKDRLWREGRALATGGSLPRSGAGPTRPPTEGARPLDGWWEEAPLAAPTPPPTTGVRLLSPTTSLVDAREVQSRLAALGYYAARIDGIWGAGSRRALSNFKRAAGLPANADWDRATRTHLFQATGERPELSDLFAE